METHAEITEYGYRVELQDAHGQRRHRHRRPKMLTALETLVVGWGAGLLAGVVLALPLILWDWVRAPHRALELPMAVTAWLFGLNHFSHQTNLVWPIVVGFAFLCLYVVASGIAFTALADRVYRIATLGKALVAGAAWSFVNFIFVWYMLLPIARSGAPLRPTLFAPGLFVAPNWVWILSFTAFGLAMGAFYAMLRTPPREREVEEQS